MSRERGRTHRGAKQSWGGFFGGVFILTLESSYIKRHTAMIEGLDNRTRIQY